MQIVPFLTHYQLVYANFDFSSFSLISYIAKAILLDDENMAFVSLKHRDSYAVAIFLNANNIFIVKWYCFF